MYTQGHHIPLCYTFQKTITANNEWFGWYVCL